MINKGERYMRCNRPRIGTMGLGGQSVFLTVDHFHSPGETLHASSMFIEPGGKAYNQAVAAARLGAEVVFIGAMGNDEAKEQCCVYLKSENVTPIIETIVDENTAYACILTDNTGENRVSVFRGAAEQLSKNFVSKNEKIIAQCSCMLLSLESPLNATKTALNLCKKHGVFTILNPAPAIPLEIEFLHSFDLITPNLQEAAFLLGLQNQPDTKTLAQHLKHAGFKRAVVTLGENGSLLLDASCAWIFPALPSKVVDTTGAGDTFNAALAVFIAEGYSLKEAAIYATNASSFCVSHANVMDSLPTRNQLLNVFREIVPIRIL